MSESTPDTTSEAPRTHLKPVPEEASAPAPAQAAPAATSGSHFTGLLALLLAVAVFALLAQFSANQGLEAENLALSEQLSATQAELQASQEQMSSAREAMGGLKDVLARIEGLLAPPVAAVSDAAGDAGEAITGEAAAE